MTQREFFNAVINAKVSDELTEFATAAIAKLDKRNATPSKADKEKAAANELIMAKLMGVLNAAEAPMVAADLAAAVEINTQKASALLLKLCAAGSVVQSEVKIKGRGKVKAYAATSAENSAE